MKGFRQFLEAWHDTMGSPYKSTKDSHFDIHKNPSKNDLTKLVHGSEAKAVRAILHKNDVYVWDAMHSHHSAVKDHLKLDGARHYINVRKDRYDSEYAGSGEGAEPIKKHPWVSKTLSKHRFFHS